MTSDVVRDVVSAADELCDALQTSARQLAQTTTSLVIRCALLVQKKNTTNDTQLPLLQVVTSQAVNTSNSTPSCSSSVPTTELAVCINAAAVRQALIAYCTSTFTESDLIAYDHPVAHFASLPQTSSSTREHKSPALLLQASLLRKLPLPLLTLTLLLLPAHSGLWNERRARLVQHTSNDPATHFIACLQELLLTDMVLSAYPKLQEAWVYRGWLMQHIVHSCGCNVVCHLRAQDDATFFFAVDQHGMNYNAWQYRRLRFRLLAGTSDEDVEEECACVQHFLRTHNADSSAASYLLFLLHSLNADNLDATHKMWLKLMQFTQHELHVHVEHGHECMWWLRDGLLYWALKTQAGNALHGGWTVQDELRWTSAYADGFLAHGEAGVQRALLLSPDTQKVHEAAVQCAGSAAWSSYLACRHGLYLIQLLRRGSL